MRQSEADYKHFLLNYSFSLVSSPKFYATAFHPVIMTQRCALISDLRNRRDTIDFEYTASLSLSLQATHWQTSDRRWEELVQ